MKLVHPDIRIDKLEKHAANQEQQLKKLQAAQTALLQSVARLSAQVQAIGTSLSRLS